MSRTRLANLAVAPAIFLLPLAAVPERLAHPAPWLGLAAALVVLFSQPEIGAEEMVADRSDRRSALAIFAGQIGAQLAAVLQYGYLLPRPPRPGGALVLGGAVTVAAGLALRLWSIRTLGRWFTSTVRVQDGQTVVRSGPYRLLRHPSYTGALLTALGVTVALGSPGGIVAVFLVAVPAYLYRIRVEEARLLDGLGEPYREYSRATWRLIPYLH